jgi:hypothetical protein
MDFKEAGILGNLLSRDYALRVFALLVNYRNISASETASRLNLHIRTAQEFLDGLTDLNIVKKEEVFERKRPYYRYALNTDRISFELDLKKLQTVESDEEISTPIRERSDSGARFVTSRSGQTISAICIWTGSGRDRTERRINLTTSQGIFLYHLPFPDAEPVSIDGIMNRADIGAEFRSEIIDLVDLLRDHGIIDDTELG